MCYKFPNIMAFNKEMLIVILVGFSVFNSNIENVISGDKVEPTSPVGNWYVLAIISSGLDLSTVPQCWNVTINPLPSGSSPSLLEGFSHYTNRTTSKRVDISFKATPTPTTERFASIYYSVSATVYRESDFSQDFMNFSVLHYVKDGLAFWHMNEHEIYKGTYSLNLIASRHPNFQSGQFIWPTAFVNNNESSTCSWYQSSSDKSIIPT